MNLRPALVLLGPIALWAQDPVAPPPSTDAEAILLQPILSNTPLGEGLLVFPGPKGSTLVPLGELCRLLGFGIRIAPGGQQASGHFIQEKRRFRLDLLKGTAEVEGRFLPVSSSEVLAKGGELFVDSRLLQVWFPMKVSVDIRGAALQLEAKEKLPVQLVWEQERALKGVSAASAAAAPPLLPLQSFPYAFLDWPMVDFSAAWGTSQHTPTTPPQGSLTLTGDALWMTGQAVFTRDEKARNHLARATLFREDPEGGILGPLGARRVYLGYVQQSPVLELAGAMTPGRGLLVDNYPTAYRSTFANRTFRGNLPEGWYAELFQNGALVSMVRSRPDGLYEFPNVPMRFGLNLFKLVFHGPLGERREEIHRLDIAQDMPEAGTFYYRLASLKPTEELTSNQGDRTSSSLETEYGLTSAWAVKGALSQMSLPEGMHTYQVLGMRSALSFLALEGYASRDRSPDKAASPGSATQWVARTGYGYSTLTLSRSDFRNGFVRTSGNGSGGLMGLMRSETLLDLSQSFTLRSIPFGLSYSRSMQDMISTGKLTQDTLQISANLSRLNLTQTFHRTANDLQKGSPVPVDSTLMAFYTGDNVYRQAELGFSVTEGRTHLQRWGLGQDYQSATGTLYRFNLKGTDTLLRNAQISASINKLVGRLSYGLDLQFSQSNGYSLGLRIGASFGREPRSGRWACSAVPVGYQGGVSAQAFLDANTNGRKEAGEKPLEEARFQIGSLATENQSKDPATAFYLNTGRAQTQDVRLEVSSLEDPSHVPAKPGIRILPRPGKVFRIDYPVVVLGEITSTTRLRRNGQVEPYGGVEVELLDASGKRVKGLRSAFDGFLELRDLPLGDYVLQVTDEEVQRLNLKERPLRRIRLDVARPFQDGIDLILIDPSAPEAPPPAPASPPAPAPAPLPAPASSQPTPP